MSPTCGLNLEVKYEIAAASWFWGATRQLGQPAVLEVTVEMVNVEVVADVVEVVVGLVVTVLVKEVVVVLEKVTVC
jgi:hypothetical protein